MTDDREERARSAVRRTKKNLPWLFTKDGSQRYFRSRLEVQELELLIGVAREGNADALKFLREHARGARRAGMNVPDEFHAFVWEYFIDGPPITPSGPKHQDLFLRDMSIVSLVKIVSECGFPIHREKARHNQKRGRLGLRDCRGRARLGREQRRRHLERRQG